MQPEDCQIGKSIYDREEIHLDWMYNFSSFLFFYLNSSDGVFSEKFDKKWGFVDWLRWLRCLPTPRCYGDMRLCYNYQLSHAWSTTQFPIREKIVCVAWEVANLIMRFPSRTFLFRAENENEKFTKYKNLMKRKFHSKTEKCDKKCIKSRNRTKWSRQIIKNYK